MRGRLDNEVKGNQKIEEKIKDMPNYIKEYYNSLNEKSYTTKYRYINYVTDMIIYCTQDERMNLYAFKNVTTSSLQQYMNSLQYKNVNGKNKKISADIRAARWSAISGFYKFMNAYGYINNDIFTNYVQRPKIKTDKEVVALTEMEIKMLLDNVRKLADKRVRNRDLAIIMLSISTGLRETALTEINLEDINFEEGYITTTNKGDKTWNVYPSVNTMETIKLLIDEREHNTKIKNDSKDALFISRVGTRISPSSVGDIVKKYTEGFDKHITPHKLRSTCATNLYNKTNNILLVAETLGHTDVKVTMRYTKLDNNARKKAGRVMDDLV